MELVRGAVIADRYRLDRKVGSGGMGEVWAGEHVAVGGKVAIKTLLAAKALRRDIVTRFKREAYFLGRIQSDHVARVIDFIDDPDTGLVLVMEFVEGNPLASVLRERRLGVEEAIEIGADLASGLCDLHKARVIHRDLKPANVILRPLPDGRLRATIVDLGVSRSTKALDDDEDTLTRITRSHVALGTVEYMAPEQVLNSRDATEVSDVYALGAILFRAVSGRHVFGKLEGGSLAQHKIRSDPPELKTGRTDRLAQGLEEVVARAIQRRPSQRYASASEMLAALVPLRDLVRVAALQLESTTTTQDGRLLLLAREIVSVAPVATPAVEAPAPAEAPQAPTELEPAPVVAIERPSVPAPRTSVLSYESPARAEGRRRAATIAAFVVAAAIGGVAALVFATQRSPAAVEEAPTVAVPPAVESAAAEVPAAPSSTASAEPAPIELDDLADLPQAPSAPAPRPTPTLTGRLPVASAPAVVLSSTPPRVSTSTSTAPVPTSRDPYAGTSATPPRPTLPRPPARPGDVPDDLYP